MSYSAQQEQILSYTQTKVRDFMLTASTPGHEFDHILRVANWAVKIAQAEKANIFLCEMAGLLHDVGRAHEDLHDHSRRHHELSYEICQKWFREDMVLKNLSKKEKLILLYSVRYHWNNAADKYVEAIILRDADKLDLFGKIGVKRNAHYLKTKEKIMNGMRYRADDVFWLRTEMAREYFKKQKMFEPIFKETVRLLKSEIKPVSL